MHALEDDRTHIVENNEDLLTIFLTVVKNRQSRKQLISQGSMTDDRNSPRRAQLRRELDELQAERERLRSHLEVRFIF